MKTKPNEKDIMTKQELFNWWNSISKKIVSASCDMLASGELTFTERKAVSSLMDSLGFMLNEIHHRRTKRLLNAKKE